MDNPPPGWRDSLVVSVVTNDREIGVPVLLAAGGGVATVGQLLFAPWAWVYSTLHHIFVSLRLGAL